MAKKIKSPADIPGFREDPAKYWDIPDLLQKIPTFRKAPFKNCKVDGLDAILIKGYQKHPEDTNIDSPSPDPLSKKGEGEFFAYMGRPAGPVPPGGWPGIVMIHGGGGTALPEYTTRWIRKGYAVIALDWYNQHPVLKKNTKYKVADRVPLKNGMIQDHICNVANIALAHSLLRAQKYVNPEKTAFVGLSWGSWYGAMTAAVDDRYNGGVEIYCGDVKLDSDKLINGRFHHAGKIPLYWIVSTNDQNMTLATLNNAMKEYPELENKTIVNDLPHSHIGFAFEACARMAAFFTQNKPGLPKLDNLKLTGNKVCTKILEQGKGIRYALLCYTDSTEEVYHLRQWKSIPAEINGDTITAELPEGAHQFYVSAYEKDSKFHDLCGSTETVILPFPQK